MCNMNEVTEILNTGEFKTINDFIDTVEYVMINEMVESGEFVLIQAPLKHEFTDGMYTRTIKMPAQSRFTSVIHKFTHPFFVLTGKVAVFSENDGAQLIVAPYRGITKPGTRRVLHVIEETVWSTVHRTDIVPEDDSDEAIEKAADLVMDEITEPYENKLLGGWYKNSVFIEAKPEFENKILSHEH